MCCNPGPAELMDLTDGFDVKLHHMSNPKQVKLQVTRHTSIFVQSVSGVTRVAQIKFSL